jgi:hypothetical protein
LVGMAGFEPATTYPPDKCATKLRYIPTLYKQIFLLKRKRLCLSSSEYT